MKRSELLEDYCQKCGSTIGSSECCNSLWTKLTPKTNVTEHDSATLTDEEAEVWRKDLLKG